MNRRAQILISFDVEEFDLPEEFGVPVSPEDRAGVSADGMERILSVLDRFPDVRVTFFTTVNFAKMNPDLFRRMTNSGRHEIASHGVSHSTFGPGDLAESKRILEELSGKSVVSFRPARLAPVSKEGILGAGYRCESALNPVWLPGRYNNFTASLRPFRETCGLLQVPVSAVPVIRFPLFWLSFKNLPLPLYFCGADMAIRSVGFFNLYTHPWEYSAKAKEARWHIPAYITRRAGDAMATRLERLLRHLEGQGDFVTFSEFTDRFGSAAS